MNTQSSNFYYIYHFPIGEMSIHEKNNAIVEVSFYNPSKQSSAVLKETNLIKKTAQELLEYFQGKRQLFDLPLNPMGTDFQQQVWRALQTIPYGKTYTYKQLAEHIGNKKACRAVGMANNRNPIAIIIPCHRVIGSNGKLIGYAEGLDKKEFLLNLENNK